MLLLLLAKLVVGADVDEEILFTIHEHAKLAAVAVAVGASIRSTARPLPHEVVLVLRMIESVFIADLGSKTQAAKRIGS